MKQKYKKTFLFDVKLDLRIFTVAFIKNNRNYIKIRLKYLQISLRNYISKLRLYILNKFCFFRSLKNQL